MRKKIISLFSRLEKEDPSIKSLIFFLSLMDKPRSNAKKKFFSLEKSKKI
ncbi:hypothetical protein DB42_AA00170 [Neochlamydia sp. EPS4]|nr:hypothetical protein DB42_AA00170 [Neochlamydia sp. EPS4]